MVFKPLLCSLGSKLTGNKPLQINLSLRYFGRRPIKIHLSPKLLKAFNHQISQPLLRIIKKPFTIALFWNEQRKSVSFFLYVL